MGEGKEPLTQDDKISSSLNGDSSAVDNSSTRSGSMQNGNGSVSAEENSPEPDAAPDSALNSSGKKNENIGDTSAAPYARESGASVSSGEDVQEDGTMGLLDHLNELRKRLMKACLAVCVCFGFCWAFVDPLFNILLEPLLKILPAGTHAQYTTLPEAFFTRMYIALIAAIFVASPVIFYQIWAFVAPGLYDEEKKYIVPIALVSALFFVCGALFCYFIVFPFAFNFFISYSTPEIVITPKVSDYLHFVIKLLLAFGLIFEMPIFTLFLARMGIVTAGMMRKGRKYAIVVIFILAAILTPPDVLSQLLMACPMLILYEFSIGVAVIFGKRKPKAEEAGK